MTWLFEVESNTMVAVASAAVLFNIVLGVILHGVCQVNWTEKETSEILPTSNTNYVSDKLKVCGPKKKRCYVDSNYTEV